MNARTKYIIRANAVNVFAAVVLVTTGWMLSVWLPIRSEDWGSLKFTLGIAVPVLLFLVWVTIAHTVVRNGILRFLANAAALMLVLAVFMNSTYPIGYQWYDGLPAIGLLFLVAVLGSVFLAWLKPHMASWPFWR